MLGKITDMRIDVITAWMSVFQNCCVLRSRAKQIILNGGQKIKGQMSNVVVLM